MDSFLQQTQIIIFAVLILGGVVYLRQSITKASIIEAQRLAETRGQIIDDLQEEMDKRDRSWQEKCDAMQKQLNEMSGQMKMLQALKTSEIVDGVMVGINRHMMQRGEDGS